MARERLTRRPTAEEILADVDALERRIKATDCKDLSNWAAKLTSEEKAATGFSRAAGIDDELQNWADDIAKEERVIAEKSTGEDTGTAADDQNEKANDNWPVSASDELSDEERHQLASELTMLSKGMAKRIAQNGSLSEEDRKFVATRLLGAAKRIGKV